MPTTIGLDIGTSAVRAAQVTVSGRGPATLDRLGQVMLPVGAVRDGEIEDADAVGQAIRTLWERYDLKGRRVALGTANQQVVVRQVDLPYLPEDELRSSLQFQAQDYIPIPIEQAVLDFYVLENYENAEGEKYTRVLLVAAQRLMIDKILHAVRAAKLTPQMLDLDAFAMLRSLAPEGLFDEGEGELLLDIGTAVTSIVVHTNGVPRFVRILLMGGGDITEGLESALGMSHDDAEAAKAETTIRSMAEITGLDETTRIVSERADRFVTEVRGSVDYYAAQPESVPIRRIVLTGGGAQLPNLRERLSAALRLDVEHGHPMQYLKIGKVGLDEDQLVEAEPYLAVAIGLALGAAE